MLTNLRFKFLSSVKSLNIQLIFFYLFSLSFIFLIYAFAKPTFYLSTCLKICLPIYTPAYHLFISLCIYVSIYPYIYHLSIYLSIYHFYHWRSAIGLKWWQKEEKNGKEGGRSECLIARFLLKRILLGC